MIEAMVEKSNENRELWAKPHQASPIQAAIDCGMDVTMLVDNLQRSVTERLRRHQIALNMAEKLQKAKRLTGDCDNLLDRLVNNGVDFVIVGDWAALVHGCTYVNQWIEICCDFSPANLLALQRAVSDLEPVHRMNPQRKKLELTEETCSQFKNLYLDTKEGQLDCLSFIDGLGDFSHAKQESELVEVEETKMYVLSLDALLRTKRAMNRPRDKQAISQLEAIRELRKPPAVGP